MRMQAMFESQAGSFDLAVLLTPLALAAVVIYFTAGVVKGTLGIGFPTTAVSLMAQMTDARTAISLVVIPMLVTNAWQVWRNRRVRWVLSSFWLLIILMLVFIGIFSQVATLVPIALLTATLGLIVSLYAATSLYRPVISISDSYDKPAQIIAGITSGAMGGVAGVWAPPLLIYLNARKLTKEQFVSTTGVFLFLGSCILILGYSNAGLLGGAILTMSCLLLIPSMAGFTAGELIRNRLSAKRFERVLLWFFLIMGLNLIRRSFV